MSCVEIIFDASDNRNVTDACQGTSPDISDSYADGVRAVGDDGQENVPIWTQTASFMARICRDGAH